MRHLVCLRRAAIFGMLCVVAPRGAVVFEDDFSDGAGNWLLSTATEPDTATEGGVFAVESASAGMSIFRHGDTLGDFTFSVDLTVQSSSFEYAGVGFCTRANLGGYYLLIDPAKHLMVMRMPEGGGSGSTILAFLPHSAISNGLNRLTVSKKGSVFNLFCNNRFLTDFVDSTYDSGSVALTVVGIIEAEFDNVRVTDGFKKPGKSSCLAADFDEETDNVFYTGLSVADISVDSGVLRVESPDTSFQSLLFAAGRWDGYSLRTIVEQTAGDSMNAYGICFVEITQEPDMSFSYRTYSFLINAAGFHQIVRADDDSLYWPQVRSGHVNAPDGLPDTLEALVIGEKFVFAANGDTMVKATVPDDFRIDGAGLVVYPSLSVEFSEFVAAESKSFECDIRRPSLAGPRDNPLHPSHRHMMIFDARGRRMPRGTSPGNSLDGRARGAYIVVDDVRGGRLRIRR